MSIPDTVYEDCSDHDPCPEILPNILPTGDKHIAANHIPCQILNRE